MYEARCLSDRRPMTFAKAMSNYLDIGKPQPKFAAKLLKHFGTAMCSDIDNSAMIAARKVLFKPDAKAPYINRHLYTPVNAILTLAARDKACERPAFSRPEGYAEHPPVESPATDAWYPTVMRELNAEARAIVAFLTVHGRRISELLTRKPAHFDAERGTLFLGKTKNARDVFIRLEPSVHALMLEMPGWKDREHLFRYKPVSGIDAVNKLIREVCARLGVPYYSTHKLGRHRFAIRMLDAGYSLQHVKDSGGWETLQVLSDRYGARAHDEHTATVHQVGSQVMKLIETGEKRGEASGEVS
jgi:integrase